MLGWAVKMKTLHVLTCSIIVGICVDARDKTAHGSDMAILKGDENCSEGFRRNHSTYHCDPICSQKCTNSICIAPGKCRCNERYYNVEDSTEHFRCKPHCDDCLYGDCTAPGQCVCRKGYTKVNSRCEPYCEPKCVNGKCIAHNKCKCFDGFTLNRKTKECEPTCDQNCNLHSTCIAPNECKCDEGYFYVGFSEDRYTCKPHCDGCSHGDCIAPKECQCKKGYRKVHSQCEPECDPSCVNGYCVSPDICKCYEGFSKPNSSVPHVCHPICDQKCIGSICVAPNECKCNEGYVNVENIDARYTCKPHCDDCSNGVCTASGVCQCEEGYTKVHSRCEPDCEPKCVNGYCVSPDTCKCYKDFHQAEPTTPHVCHPICDQKCINSTCIAPNKCKCDDGYVNAENIDTHYTCKPHCHHCSHGDCIAPGVCQCKEGYEKMHSSCLPVCTFGCKHGTCIAPEKCQCNEGYRNNEYGCSPSCNPDCINGICESANQCRCHKGTWKSGASYCALKCSEFPYDKKCYHGSHNHSPPLKYTLNEANASLELSASDSISIQVPFEHFPTTVIAGYMVMDFMCFTDLRPEEDGAADIVCSPAYDAAQCHSVEEGGPPVSVRSSLVKTVDLVFLHRNTSHLRTTHICQHSKRVFFIKGTSKLSVCLEIGRKIEERNIGEVFTSSVVLYSTIVIAVASAVGYITSKWVSRKKLHVFKFPDPNRVSHRPLIESDCDLGEIGPQAVEFTDISDRLDDLK